MAMTSLQRSLLAIDQLQPDRIPVIPQAHIWASYNYGSSSDELMYNGTRYAEIQIQAQRDFGWDGIFIATDSCALAHSLGLEVLSTDLGVAPSPEGILQSLDEVDRLELIDPRTSRLNEWITATRLLAEAVGDEVLIIARADQGAFSLAAQLRGMQDFLLDVGYGKHDAQIHQLLTFCNQYILQFAEYLMAAGAHVVTIGDALASGSLISPKTYARYAFPYHQAMAEAIRARGGRLSIHVCGKTTHVIEPLANTGAHIVEFDSMTDFDTALAAARGKTCLLGNVDVPEVITFGTREQVVSECRWRLERVKPHSGYILSSGCAISPNAPAANLHAMVESAQEYGRY